MTTPRGQNAEPVFAVALPGHEVSKSELFSQIMTLVGLVKKSPIQIARDYIRLAAGPGKISPDDFIKLRLFDGAFYSGADVREFIGEKQYRDICYTVNYRHDWIGMLSNKVASASYLHAHGLSVIPAKAVYAPHMQEESPALLCSKGALEHFLLRPEVYPLFGKPIESQNSLGSVGLAGCSPATREVSLSTGSQVRAEDLAAEIDARYPAGYLFQPLLAPHAKIAALTGNRLATARFLTIATESGAQVFRACWKIPVGSNVADNYWRSGNLLAHLDLESGRIIRATSGSGLETLEHSKHPDTKVPLLGFVHPQWKEMKKLALSGARLMHTVPLVGWDIACTDAGPVIVEMNEYPDAFLMQFADRGLLDETFKRFVEFQKQNRAEFQAANTLRNGA